MKLTIKGSVGDNDVDLEVELSDADVSQLVNQLKFTSENTDPPSPLVRSRPDPKTSELSESLNFIQKQGKVTQYQLIDQLADLGLKDADIKRAIMWLNHHADIKVETQSKGQHSQYHIFHWQPTD